MTLYLLLGFLLLASIAPSLASPGSVTRPLRFLFVLAVYPVFGAIAVFESTAVAGVLWLILGAKTLLLDLAADRLLPPKYRSPFLSILWKAALLWPLLLPAALETLLIAAGLAPERLPATLPEPPRGKELFTLSDDDLLVAAHQILGGGSKLTDTEETLWLAETFSREVHVGGLAQWFSNTDSSVPETARALRAVGASKTAELLLQASEAFHPLKGPSDDLFLEATGEDLSSLNAGFLRRNRERCPTLHEKPTPPEDQGSGQWQSHG